ncbi:hypothetical protein [Actinomadura parmotrematis]|uniref:Uncharacterized protein n=1 Tax=Actinomadura parmotrematis TaxID=2864039 RepID=A0ABS7FP72_9ACTN|nr:hypothetical protein [Actinomadura parmotrematis]MBW8482195.1 hypothetical protein [Actinomadura parmotrematis]
MIRSEAAAWSLAGGAFSVFAVAVVAKGAPWPFAFAVLGLAVAGWALHGGPAAGGALGAIAWAVGTGFDVAGNGTLAPEGAADAGRAAALVAAGLAAGAAGRWLARTGDEPGGASPLVPEDRPVPGTLPVPVMRTPARTPVRTGAPTKETHHA